jgi:hypothetical protein
LKDRDLGGCRPDRYGQTIQDLAQVELLDADHAIARHDEAHLVPQPRQRLGERAGDIRQSAGFRKGHGFRDDKKNLHAQEERRDCEFWIVDFGLRGVQSAIHIPQSALI